MSREYLYKATKAAICPRMRCRTYEIQSFTIEDKTKEEVHFHWEIQLQFYPKKNVHMGGKKTKPLCTTLYVISFNCHKCKTPETQLCACTSYLFIAFNSHSHLPKGCLFSQIHILLSLR